MTVDEGIEDCATGCDGSFGEEGAETGDAELHCLDCGGEGVEGARWTYWDLGDVFVDHCYEFIFAEIAVG
jgi:hypothetical protein